MFLFIIIIMLKATLQFQFLTPICFAHLVTNLGVSEELQIKLQDVMILRNLLAIGKVLGEG